MQEEAVIVLSAEPSVGAVTWTVPSQTVVAGSSIVVKVAPPCTAGCTVHFGDQTLPITGAGESVTVAVPRSPTGPYVVWVNATTQPGLLFSTRGSVVVTSSIPVHNWYK